VCVSFSYIKEGPCISLDQGAPEFKTPVPLLPLIRWPIFFFVFCPLWRFLTFFSNFLSRSLYLRPVIFHPWISKKPRFPFDVSENFQFPPYSAKGTPFFTTLSFPSPLRLHRLDLYWEVPSPCFGLNQIRNPVPPIFCPGPLFTVLTTTASRSPEFSPPPFLSQLCPVSYWESGLRWNMEFPVWAWLYCS